MDIIQERHINNRRMAPRDTTTIRVKNVFTEDCLDKIIEIERKKGRDDTSYATASKILRDKIIAVGFKDK